MTLSMEGVAAPHRESTAEHGKKIRAHVHNVIRKLIARQAEANKKSCGGFSGKISVSC